VQQPAPATPATSTPVTPALPRRADVVVPVRALEGGKSRLGAVLDPEERRDLVVRLLRRIVREALATPGVAEVLVISPDADALAEARGAGARPVLQTSRGLNPALVEARDAATAPRMLVVPGDLSAVTAADLAAMLDAGDAAGTPSVVLAPDRHGRGTNALLLDPPDIIEPAFGGGSREGHAWLARSAGAAYVEVTARPGLENDLDMPEDLMLAEALHGEEPARVE
jgi:2-phospho-L-lactate/phosphoenolpyruvate guanylyltransferase